MRVKTIVEEDFTNYKKPAMFIGTISCGGKCCLEEVSHCPFAKTMGGAPAPPSR